MKTISFIKIKKSIETNYKNYSNNLQNGSLIETDLFYLYVIQKISQKFYLIFNKMYATTYFFYLFKFIEICSFLVNYMDILYQIRMERKSSLFKKKSFEKHHDIDVENSLKIKIKLKILNRFCFFLLIKFICATSICNQLNKNELIK